MLFHCHILYHSDMGMASRLAVVGTASECAHHGEALQTLDRHGAQYCGRGTHWHTDTDRCLSDSDGGLLAERAQYVILALVCVVAATFAKLWPGMSKGRPVCCWREQRCGNPNDDASSLDVSLSHFQDSDEGESL